MKQVTIIFLLIMLPLATAIPAFPGAEGHGAQVLGARGPTGDGSDMVICSVNTLDDDARNPTGRQVNDWYYEGMLTYCIDRIHQPRMIVFNVGGYRKGVGTSSGSNQPSRYSNSEDSYFYLAGQTAPGDGYVLRNVQFGFGNEMTHGVIRYLTIIGGGEHMVLTNPINNFILDHLSAKWNTNDGINVYASFTRGEGAEDNTMRQLSVQRSLQTEAFNTRGGLKVASNPDGSQLIQTDISMHHNAIIHADHRSPTYSGHRTEYINTVTYNGKRAGGESYGVNFPGAEPHDMQVDIIGNYWKTGPFSQKSEMDCTRFRAHHPQQSDTNLYPPPYLYLEGNVCDNPGFTQGDPQKNMISTHPPIHYMDYYYENSWIKPTPFEPAPIPVTIQTAEEAYNELINANEYDTNIYTTDQTDSVVGSVGNNARVTCDGTWEGRQDEIDRRSILSAREGLGWDLTNTNDIIGMHWRNYTIMWNMATRDLNKKDSNGWPIYQQGTPCKDPDYDGMPTAFEIRYGFNPNSADGNNNGILDFKEDPDEDGYTNIEEYVNGENPLQGTTTSECTLDTDCGPGEMCSDNKCVPVPPPTEGTLNEVTLYLVESISSTQLILVEWNTEGTHTIKSCCRVGGGAIPGSPYEDPITLAGTTTIYTLNRLLEDSTQSICVRQHSTNIELCEQTFVPAAGTNTYQKEDVNEDGTVNLFDLVLVAGNIGTNNLQYDVNTDGSINLFDLVAIVNAINS